MISGSHVSQNSLFLINNRQESVNTVNGFVNTIGFCSGFMIPGQRYCAAFYCCSQIRYCIVPGRSRLANLNLNYFVGLFDFNDQFTIFSFRIIIVVVFGRIYTVFASFSRFFLNFNYFVGFTDQNDVFR